jgi:ribosomal protein S12 methylthiotransferase accessory factor
LFSEDQALWKVTPGDRGIVERPMLAPHLEFRPLGGEAAILVSETFNTLLYGQRYLDLLPLVDGTCSRHEIAAALADRHSKVEVQTALVSLASKGYIVSAEFCMERQAAAFWTSLGVSPRWAEERLSAARVSITGDDGSLAAALASMAVASVKEDPTLVVVVTDDYLNNAHAERNRRHLASGTPWMLVKPDGVWPLFGPVFHPREEDDVVRACWACLSHRIGGNREVENVLRTVSGDAAAIRPRAVPPAFAAALRGLAATEIAKWIVLGDISLLHEHAVSLDVFGLDSQAHRIAQRPQCAACGDGGLHRPDRTPAPVRLQPSPKSIRNSGGLRSVPPEETVRRYRHLISPLSGVVTQLTRITDEADSWLTVHWAGSNLALRTDSLIAMRSSLRTKSSGKGATPEQSEASALCEAVERYSGSFHGEEIIRRARFVDFAEGEAIHPNDIQLFSDRQYENAAEINARRFRFYHVPKRFDPSVEKDWTPVWSLTAGQHRWLPTEMLYYGKPIREGAIHCPPDSNGCAAGNTLEEAILQGFFELAERDAFACWWYNRVSLPEVNLDSFNDAYLSGARDYYRAYNREIWVLDATNDLGVAVFVAVSRRTDKEAEDILFSAGAHLDPHIAALRAVCELNQYFCGIRDAKADGSGYLYDDPESLWWWHNAKIADHLYLLPRSGGAGQRSQTDYPVPQTADIRDDVEFCRALVEAKGMEFLVLDQTRPDIGMPVARVIVPGLRHFWARFGAGRLYDVPAALGWLDAPTAESDLNPIPVFI